MTSWVQNLQKQYESGISSAFILHGNVRDQVAPGLYLRRYLSRVLNDFAIIVYYSPRASFEFARGEDIARKIISPETFIVNDDERFWPIEPIEAFEIITRLLFSKEKVAVIVFYADTIFSPPPLSVSERALLVKLHEIARYDAGLANLLILVTDSLDAIPASLRESAAGFRAIEIPKPDFDSRLKFIRKYCEVNTIDIAESEIIELARNTAGLTLSDLESVFLNGVDKDSVRAIKREIIMTQYAGLVDILEPDPRGFDALGGLTLLKAWAERKIIRAIKAGQKPPKGVLLVGPPGTGKTAFISALAGEINYNAVLLNMENVLNSYVGESEKRLRAAFDLIRSLAPVLVFIDEIDQSDISRRGNESGNPVASNLFSQVLRFLSQDLPGVTVFAASNRPDLIDPALLRFGRFSAVVPVLLPNRAERAEILRIQARLQNVNITDEAVALIAEATENYSGADLAAIVAKAADIGNGDIDVQAALYAVNAIRPNSVKDAQFFTLLAVNAVNDLDLLPGEYRDYLNDRAALSRKLEELRGRDDDAPQFRGKK